MMILSDVRKLSDPRNLTCFQRNCAGDGKTWLLEAIAKENEKTLCDKSLELPLKSDGKPCLLDDLFYDQHQIMTRILSKLRGWLSHLSERGTSKSFKPLRLTIMGAAGTGKSVLINTLVTVLRKMFGLNDVVHVAAPTGTAAFNVGGETLHRLFSVSIDDVNGQTFSISEKTKRALLVKFQRTIAILIDERSMVGMKLLGTASHNAALTAHGGVSQR